MLASRFSRFFLEFSRCLSSGLWNKKTEKDARKNEGAAQVFMTEQREGQFLKSPWRRLSDIAFKGRSGVLAGFEWLLPL